MPLASLRNLCVQSSRLARFRMSHCLSASQSLRQVRYSSSKSDRSDDFDYRSTSEAKALQKTQYGVEVYVGSMKSMVRNVKMFSLSTSLASLCAQPYLVSRAAELPLFVKAVLFGGFSFIFCTPLLLHVFTRQYVTSLHYDAATEQFTAVVYNLVLRRKLVRFTAKDTQPPHSAFSLLANCEVRGLPLYFHLPDFIDLSYYQKMMRYIGDGDIVPPSERKTGHENDD